MTQPSPSASPTVSTAQPEDYFQLLKPRVMSLVVFTAFVGLIVAPGNVHPLIAFCSVLFIAIGGGASGALNMWYDADIDAVMNRTKSRPIPSGKVAGPEALAVGLSLSGIAVMMLGLSANWFAAGFLAFTIFFYAVVYTMWLKRWTPQNIVIGGAAGALQAALGRAVARCIKAGGVHCHTAGVIAAVFEPLQALHKDGNDVARGYRADDAAHGWCLR